MVKTARLSKNPYHDEEYAKRFLLSKYHTIYYPAPNSDIFTISWRWSDFNYGNWWKDTPQYIRLLKTISNPLQLAPQNNYIGVARNTTKDEDSTDTHEVTGVWRTQMVGPLFGKPYTHTVPIKKITTSLGFYYPSKESNFIIGDYGFNFKNRWDALRNADSFVKRCILTATVKEELKKCKLQNILYFNTGYDWGKNKIYQPVNYNPVHTNLDYFFVQFEWGEMLLNGPNLALQQEDLELYDGIISAQEVAQKAIEEWIYDQDELFEFVADSEYEEDNGWNISSDWGKSFGTWIMEEWGVKADWLWNFVDGCLGWQLTHLDPWQKTYLIDNKEGLERVRESGILPWLFGLEDHATNLDEWVREILDNNL
tara:strand:+ start:7221 stop:8324 length:1104 start_codon:yes stop_codon:yes gene_type:complete